MVTASVDARPATAPALRRASRRLPRLVVHAAGLLALLLAGLTVVGTGIEVSADEGAALAQAQHLADTGDWAIPHPFPEADPDDRLFPLEAWQRTDDGYVPFPKRPAYIALLAGLYGIGEATAAVVLSMLGTVAAAAGTARLARRLDPRLEVPVFWVTGLVSPLFFDGYLVMAHTVGAACAAGALLCGVRYAERRRLVDLAGLGLLVVAAVLVRSEALILAAAVAAAFGLEGLRRRRRSLLVVGAVAVLAGAAAQLGNALLERELFGDEVALGVRGSYEGTWLGGRWHSLYSTWLAPGYGPAETQGTMLVLAVLLGTAAVLLLRRGHPDKGLVVPVAVLAGAVSVLALASDTPEVVPGLLIAFPLWVWGLLLLERPTLEAPFALTLLVCWATFAAGVLATQYPFGGGSEWGGRYFAVGLPAIVPVAVASLRAAATRLERSTVRVLAVTLGVVCACLTAAQVLSIRATHDAHRRFTADVAAAMGVTGAAAGGGQGERPVVLAADPLFPRLAWRLLDDGRWLLTEPDDLRATLDQLRTLGVERVVLLTQSTIRDADAVVGSGFAEARPDRTDRPSPDPAVVVLHAT